MVSPWDGLPMGWSAYVLLLLSAPAPSHRVSPFELTHFIQVLMRRVHSVSGHFRFHVIWPLDVCLLILGVWSFRYTGLSPPHVQRTVSARDRLVQHATQSDDPSALSTHRPTKRIRKNTVNRFGWETHQNISNTYLLMHERQQWNAIHF